MRKGQTMKKNALMRRVLAGILCTSLVFQSVSVTAYATETGIETNTESTTEISEQETETVEEISTEISETEESKQEIEDVLEVAEESSKVVYEFVDEVTAYYKTVAYNGGNPFDISNIKENIIIKKNNSVYTTLYDAQATEFAGMTMTWKYKDSNGTYVNMAEGEYPVNIGEYLYVVELPKAEDIHDGAKIEIELSITKSKLNPSVALYSMNPGSKVSDIKVMDLYVYSKETGKTFEYIPDDENTEDINENEQSQLQFTTKVRNPFTNEVIDGNAILANNTDYVVDFEISFTDKVNEEDIAYYELVSNATKELSVNNPNI